METTASLIVLLIVTGLWMWLPKAGIRAVVPDLRARGRNLFKSLHTSVGTVISLFLLLFVLSGLSWSGIWGAQFVQPWASFPAEKSWKNIPLSDRTHASMNHAGHQDVAWGMEQVPMPASGSDAGAAGVSDRVTLDTVSAWAVENGFSGQYKISIPQDEAGVFTVMAEVRNEDGVMPWEDRTTHLDQYTGNVLADIHYAEYSLMAKAMACPVTSRIGSIRLWSGRVLSFCWPKPGGHEVKTDRLIPNPPQGLRQRTRSYGTTRIWWEPSGAARALGFSVVELDETRLTWSRREAEKLNRELAQAQRNGRRTARAPGGRTIEALIEQYRKSLAFTELAPKTQDSYSGHFRLIVEKWGASAVRDFTKPVMRAWYETLYRTKSDHMAIAQIRAMSLLFSHAEMIGWRAEGTNPCLRLKMKTPKPRKRAASWDEVDLLVATADRIGLPSVGTAILLSLLQGQRQTDVFSATAGDFEPRLVQEGGKPRTRVQWTFTRSKRGNSGALWLHSEVQGRVLSVLDGGNDPARRLLRDELTGADYDDELFGRRFRKVRDEAVAADKQGKLTGLSRLQFRDLRRTFGILSRSGGATKDDTGDVLGNSAASNPQLANTYMPSQLDTASRAVEAIRRPMKPKRRA